MALFVESSRYLFDSLSTGGMSDRDRKFLSDRIEERAGRVSETGRRFYERAKQVYNEFNADNIRRGLRALKRKIEHRWDSDIDIRPIRTIGGFQQAGLTGQRWSMANIQLRHLVHKGRAEGWADTYVDAQPNEIGHQHRDYQLVMQGTAVTDQEDNTHFVTYLDVIDDPETLEHDEQLDIQESWSFLDQYVALGGDDPSSKSNSSL